MQISREKKLEMLRALLLSRRFEEALTELCKIEGKIHGMMILCTGQAAVVMEEAFAALKAPLRRVTGPDIPVRPVRPWNAFISPTRRN